ncbi:MAG TPA: TonB-dependent receptor, partial [Sphingobacteriaceae bacterium]|nr:TonB-dependent receptor [Sphingobacteriaceae bacterium]
MKKIKLVFILSVLVCSFIRVQAQSDTTQLLKEVTVNAYFSKQPILRSPASVGILDLKQLNNQPKATLVSAINTIPGVRMEERSPGSYRLSIRGSLLRSPFGIRNVKMYIDEFPLTDAGGNTYLNLLDAGSVNGIEILKGPEASIFGANSGGVILIDPTDRNADNSVSANINGGSYGLFHEKAALQQKWKDYQLNISQAYQRSDGYRQNSALQRSYIHT